VHRPYDSDPYVNNLWTQWFIQPTEEVKKKLAERYLYVCRVQAERFSKKEDTVFSFDDCYSTACVALMKGIERYKPDRQARFATYIEKRIRFAMIDELREWTKSRTTESRNVSNQKYGITGRYITQSDLRQRQDDSGDDMDVFEGYCDVHETIGEKEDRDVVINAIATTRREKLEVGLYFFDGLTMREIGETLGMSETSVSLDLKTIIRRAAEIPFIKKILMDRVTNRAGVFRGMNERINRIRWNSENRNPKREKRIRKLYVHPDLRQPRKKLRPPVRAAVPQPCPA